MHIAPEPEDLIERHIIRILFILYFCSDNNQEIAFTLPMFTESVRILNSESKLQKIDFWIRYPDHLAAALLRGCETKGIGSFNLIARQEEVRQVVRQIFDNQEPVLRWTPMRKYLRGAYEPLDKVMTFLSSRDLAYRRVTEQGHRVQYELTLQGHTVVEKLLGECPETHWYAERCKLIADFFGHLNGFEIRKLQYLETEYADTAHEHNIARIDTEIRQRFERLFGETL
mgnify:FL=1